KGGEAGGLEGGGFGLAAIDLSTGEFVLESLNPDGLEEALSRLGPAEIVIPAGAAYPLTRPSTGSGQALPASSLLTSREHWEFDPALAREELARRFGLASLDGLGLGSQDDPAIGA